MRLGYDPASNRTHDHPDYLRGNQCALRVQTASREGEACEAAANLEHARKTEIEEARAAVHNASVTLALGF
jgi:hypothetical protein